MSRINAIKIIKEISESFVRHIVQKWQLLILNKVNMETVNEFY